MLTTHILTWIPAEKPFLQFIDLNIWFVIISKEKQHLASEFKNI